MVKIKQPVTYDEQIAILESRGCIIQDEHQCKTVLSRINYYRFSAYFLPFKQDNEKYAEGTTFEKIYHIYEFDRQLRNILYDALETIEITLRTRLAYFHAMEYGALGYLNPDSFNKQHQNDIFKNNIDREIQNNRKVLFVKHHLDKYEEIFLFGLLRSYLHSGCFRIFIAILKQKIRKLLPKNTRLIIDICGAGYGVVLILETYVHIMEDYIIEFFRQFRQGWIFLKAENGGYGEPCLSLRHCIHLRIHGMMRSFCG
jgi:abortive infection bacteriophage resistance protein